MPCTTISDLNAGLRQTFKPDTIRLDADTAARIALAYGLVLYKLLPLRDFVKRLDELGITGPNASEFISIVAQADLAMHGDRS